MDPPAIWDETLQRISQEGYEAVEAIPLTYQSDPLHFLSLLSKHSETHPHTPPYPPSSLTTSLPTIDLKLIIQIHTCGGYLSSAGEYVYCSSDEVTDHVTSFHNQVISALEMKPILINCHSGVDSWNEDQALSYFQQVLSLEDHLLLLTEVTPPEIHKIPIVHETHRQRLLYNPFQTRALLSHSSLKNLKINADLSHWVCVCERIFVESNDRWWPNLLNLIASHCHFIHARVGYAEGPQVPDPRSEVWRQEVESHLVWWEKIWSTYFEKSQSKKEEEQVFIIEPEHGPAPYQIYSHVCPGSHEEISEQTQDDINRRDEILWEINNYIASIVRRRWEERQQEQKEVETARESSS